MQDTVVQAIEEATLEVFSLMVGMDIVPETLSPEACHELDSNIVSSFTLSGAVCGTAEVFYTLPLAECIACHMLQVEPPAQENDVLDAAGELANMIVGNVKNSLERRLGTIRIGTPTVTLVGRSAAADHDMSVSFRCCENVFTVSVAFEETPSHRNN